MTDILIVFATRYGSTETIAGWIGERLALSRLTTAIIDAESMPDPSGYQAVILGSGIYAHKFLPAAENYIKEYAHILHEKKTALFGAAMRKETFFRKGRAFGGAVMLERYGAMLGGGCATGSILGGEMIYEKLSDKDRDGLEKFYSSIGLSDMEKGMRRQPRTLLDKKECWDFAEDFTRFLKR